MRRSISCWTQTMQDKTILSLLRLVSWTRRSNIRYLGARHRIFLNCSGLWQGSNLPVGLTIFWSIVSSVQKRRKEAYHTQSSKCAHPTSLRASEFSEKSNCPKARISTLIKYTLIFLGIACLSEENNFMQVIKFISIYIFFLIINTLITLLRLRVFLDL